MKTIRIPLFIVALLLSFFYTFAQNTHRLDLLLSQSDRSDASLRQVISELSQIRHNYPELTLNYLNKADAAYRPKPKSDEKFKLIILKVNLLNEMGKYDAAIQELNTFIGQLGNSSKKDIYAVLWIELADNYYRKGNLDSTSINLNISKEMLSADYPEYNASWLMCKSSEQALKGNYAAAIKTNQEAARYYEKTGNDNSLAIAYNNLGDNYIPLNKPQEALKYFLKAAEINKRIHVKHGLAMNYNNAGAMCSQIGNLDKAIAYYQLAFDIVKELNNPTLMAQNIMNRGNIYEKKKDYLNAEKCFNECLSICETHGIDFGRALAFTNLGNLAVLTKEFGKSEAYLNQALALSKQMGVPSLTSQVYERQARLYAAKGDYKRAFLAQENFHILRDSLFNEKTQQEALELKEKYESEKKSNEINQLNQQTLGQQLIIALLGIGLLLLVIWLQRFRLKQKLIATERQQDELQKLHLRSLVDTKDKELTAQAAQLLQMQQDVKATQVKIMELIESELHLPEGKRKTIKTTLQKNQFSRFNADFDRRITDTNADFYKILLDKHPDLTPTELKICAYLRLNISTKEISQLTNRSVRTIESIRTDIRKKMKLQASENLINYLIALI